MSVGLIGAVEVEEEVEVAGMVAVPVTVTPCRIDDIMAGDAVGGRKDFFITINS